MLLSITAIRSRAGFVVAANVPALVGAVVAVQAVAVPSGGPLGADVTHGVWLTLGT